MSNNGMLRDPIFLVGAQRSGSTMLRLMLDSHPQIAFLRDFRPTLWMMNADGTPPDMQEYRRFLEGNRSFQMAELKIDPTLDFAHLQDSFLRQKQAKEGKPLVGTSVAANLDRVTWLWPSAKLIYLYRDGRDVARSFIELGWAGNFWTAPQQWIDSELAWKRVKQQIPPSQYAEVRYEDLLTHPERELTRLCDFMGVAYSDQMLSYPERTTYLRPDVHCSEKWRKHMSDAEIRLVEARIGPLLAERGYRLSGLTPFKITPRLERRYRRQCAWSRRRFRIRRFGLWLFTFELIARRLRLHKPWLRNRQKMNAIEMRYVQ